MKRAREYKWVLYGVCIVITLAGLCVFVLRKVSRDLQARAFQDYILLEYMPAQRKKQKEWPSTLNGVEQVSENSILHHTMVEYYHNSFIKIEPVLKCGGNYVYRIFTKDRNRTCKATINPEGGYCWSDSG